MNFLRHYIRRFLLWVFAEELRKMKEEAEFKAFSDAAATRMSMKIGPLQPLGKR